MYGPVTPLKCLQWSMRLVKTMAKSVTPRKLASPLEIKRANTIFHSTFSFEEAETDMKPPRRREIMFFFLSSLHS